MQSSKHRLVRVRRRKSKTSWAEVNFETGRSVSLGVHILVVGVILELDKAIEKHNAPVSIVVEDSEGGRMQGGLR